MAPEIAKKKKWGEILEYNPFAADLRSLGVTIYQCLTFGLPFKPEDNSVKAYLDCLRNENLIPD